MLKVIKTQSDIWFGRKNFESPFFRLIHDVSFVAKEILLHIVAQEKKDRSYLNP